MKDDVELLKDYAQTRSEEAFAELVRRQLPLVYSAALRQVGGDQALAQDVAQSVFIDLARKAASLSLRPPLTGWLYTSTRFAASNALREEQRRRVRERKAMDMQDPFATSAPEPAWAALSPVLDEAMAQLDVTDRNAVLLRFFERKQLKAVGAALQMTEDAARMRIRRALEQLRTLLRQRGVALSATALSAALAEGAVGAAPAGLAPAVSAAAVAGGAAGTAALPVALRLLTMPKARVAVIGVILVVGVAVPWAMKQQPRPQQVEIAQQTGAAPPETLPDAVPPPAADAAPPPTADPLQPQTTTLLQQEMAAPPLRPAPRRSPDVAPRPPPLMPALPVRPGAPLEQAAAIREIRPARVLSVRPLQRAPAGIRSTQLPLQGITNAAVLRAIGKVAQFAFVLPDALTNAPCRTLESPYVVAFVAECLDPQPTDRVLQLGIGSGYEAAVLAELFQAVFSVEPQPETLQQARENLERYGYTNNVFLRQGELPYGWLEASPFDKMVFNGTPDQLSPTLINQLKPGGLLVVAVDEENQVDVFEKVSGRLIPTYSRPIGPMPLRPGAAGTPLLHPLQRVPPQRQN